MNYARLNMIVSNDFEKGVCIECPLAFMNSGGEFICPLGCRCDECPLEVFEDDDLIDAE